jgi:adenylyltransferase/sulfurtransferase
MKVITPKELKAVLNDSNYLIIDVREPYEFEDFNIGGINIPLDHVLSSLDQLDKTKNIVICCQSGKRSQAMMMTLKRKFQLDNLWSLEGGILAYQELFK